MIKIAVLLTVFNRREVTLKGLHSLHKAIKVLGEGYTFDVYMTDDGCTDGTGEAVANEFPKIKIIKGDGNLYWSGGMRKAWQAAIDSGISYNYYLWFNDDAELYEDALQTMFTSMKGAGGDAIISGAFCDKDGNVSYGGRNKKNKKIKLQSPNGTIQGIFLMNGNLVLIPRSIVDVIGIIDIIYTHSLGDWDYGCRALKKGYGVYLSDKYVGRTERHDNDIEPFFNPKYSLCKRMQLLYSNKHSIMKSFIFCKRHLGLLKALRVITIQNIYAICPILYVLRKCIKE